MTTDRPWLQFYGSVPASIDYPRVTLYEAATAAHLTDHILPDLPLRQWVLAVSKRLRHFLHRDAALQGAALRLFLREMESCLRAHSPGSRPAARLGTVPFIHRFGSTLNARLHFHCVFIDGVFDAAGRFTRDGQTPAAGRSARNGCDTHSSPPSHAALQEHLSATPRGRRDAGGRHRSRGGLRGRGSACPC